MVVINLSGFTSAGGLKNDILHDPHEAVQLVSDNLEKTWMIWLNGCAIADDKTDDLDQPASHSH
jgi:hypothetical protein